MKKIVLFLLICFLFASCNTPRPNAPQTTEVMPETSGAEQNVPMIQNNTSATEGGAVFDNAWEYCQAVQNIDYPDQRYRGPGEVREITKILMQAADIHEAAIDNIRSSWRCQSGTVRGCLSSINGLCLQKYDTVQTAPDVIIEECKIPSNEGVTIQPQDLAAETPYSWVCRGGTPTLGQQVIQVDQAGFEAALWSDIPRP